MFKSLEMFKSLHLLFNVAFSYLGYKEYNNIVIEGNEDTRK